VKLIRIQGKSCTKLYIDISPIKLIGIMHDEIIFSYEFTDGQLF
jgi:hypothetical protein